MKARFAFTLSYCVTLNSDAQFHLPHDNNIYCTWELKLHVKHLAKCLPQSRTPVFIQFNGHFLPPGKQPLQFSTVMLVPALLKHPHSLWPEISVLHFDSYLFGYFLIFFQDPVLDLSLLLWSLYLLPIDSHGHTQVYSDNFKGISDFKLSFESQIGLCNFLFKTSTDYLLDQFPKGLCPHPNVLYHTNFPKQLINLLISYF